MRTRLDPREVQSAFHELKREGEGQPNPSQGEVVAFLTEQEFHVRHDETLTTARKAPRKSCLTRPSHPSPHLVLGVPPCSLPIDAPT